MIQLKKIIKALLMTIAVLMCITIVIIPIYILYYFLGWWGLIIYSFLCMFYGFYSALNNNHQDK